MNQPAIVETPPLSTVEQLTVIELCLRNDKLTSAADACAAGLAHIAKLEADRAALVAALEATAHEIESALAVSITVTNQGHSAPLHPNLALVLDEALLAARATLAKVQSGAL